jgi:hypothetical protein
MIATHVSVTGPGCSVDGDRYELLLLQFLPVSFPHGYVMLPNVTTWAHGILYDVRILYSPFVLFTRGQRL